MLYIFSLIFFFTGFVLILFSTYILDKDCNNNIIKKISTHFCILIPASYESSVIEQLLISIKNQTRPINMEDVYVIVESIKDSTVNICSKYNVNVYVRKHKKNKKGYAIDDCIKSILTNKKYDAYFVIDANSILDKNYYKEMEKTFKKGYDVAIGYRNSKSSNNIISCCSQLILSLVNNVINKYRYSKTSNIIILENGYYISGDIINDLKGFPFYSLTEDYEFTLYLIQNQFTSAINTKAIFYDEQITSIKQLNNQLIRWIKGYFESINKIKITVPNNSKNFGSRINAIIGIRQYIYIILGYILLLIQELILHHYFNILIIILLSYIILSIFSSCILVLDKNINMSNLSKLKSIIFSPILIILFIYCAIKSIFIKNVKN